MTEDMCVTHFLIQPDPEGVKLQGWSERAFSECVSYCMQCISCVHQKHHVYCMCMYMYYVAFRFACIYGQKWDAKTPP